MAIKIFEGLSTFNRRPIAAYLSFGSANIKTGMADTLWVMSDNANPVTAAKNGEDEAVCGDCRHRRLNEGTCYVLPYQAPLSVWKNASNKPVTRLKDIFPTTPTLRLGGYGDPSVLPFSLVNALSSMYKVSLGYTHLWKRCNPEYKTLLLASVDSEAERLEAKAMGWRTFRVRKTSGSVETDEIVCINEQDNLVQCNRCRLCSGNKPLKDIVVTIHGSKYKINRFNNG